MGRRPSLSLINKPQQWSRGMPLFDKQEGHCLRISTQVVKRPELRDVRRVTDTVDRGGHAVDPGLTRFCNQ